MRIGVLLNARIGSKRLPKKHLRDISGTLAIEHLMRRVKIDDDLVYILATGNERENKVLEHSARKEGFHIFYGDQMNIPNRHLQAAKQHMLDAIINLDGDDLLVSSRALEDVVDALNEGKALVRTEGLPLGMNVLWSYTVSMLKKCLDGPCKGSYENGWGWIFMDQDIHRIHYEIQNGDTIRATLDYPEDLKFFRTVFSECPPAYLKNDEALCRWIISKRVNRVNKRRHLQG